MRLWDEFEEIKELIVNIGEASNAYETFFWEVYPRRRSLSPEERKEKYALYEARNQAFKKSWKGLTEIVEQLVKDNELAIEENQHLRTIDYKRLGISSQGGAANRFEELARHYVKDPYNMKTIDELELFFDIVVQHYCRVAEGWYEKQDKTQAQATREIFELSDQEKLRDDTQRSP